MLLFLIPLTGQAALSFGINFSGQFGTIDLGTGSFSPLGTPLANPLDGLGGTPGGPFYGVDSVTGNLIRIDGNGQSAIVGDTGTGPNTGPNGINVSGSLTGGQLYGLGFQNSLYLLNSVSGVATNLGTVAGLGSPDGQHTGNLYTSLSGNSTDLYYTLEVLTGPNTISETLYDINPLTLTSTAIPLTGPDRILGSGFLQGTLTGFTYGGQIVSIDTTSGSESVTASYDVGVAAPGGLPFTGIMGAVDVPEPATMGLFAAGMLIVLGRAVRPRRCSKPD